jgi:hypothetical protein
VEQVAKTLRDLRIAEVISQDVVIENGKVSAYRMKVKLSLKYEGTCSALRTGVGIAQSTPHPSARDSAFQLPRICYTTPRAAFPKR